MADTSVDRTAGDTVCFHSPTKGTMSREDVFEEIARSVTELNGPFEIIVGTDSQLRRRGRIASFVIAVSLIRTGHGGAFFYHKFQEQHVTSLQERMYLEAFYTVGLASLLRQYLQARSIGVPIRLHFDVGAKGPTHKFLKQLLCLAKANDFEAFIKPDAYGATTVADKFTR